jgi:predicted ester cyclase
MTNVQVTVGDPRGSLWRRWDPHVHLPGTVLNDQFGALDLSGALNILASRDPTIEVVGVTDYLVTNGFRVAYDAWSQGAGASIRSLIVNVELRLDVITAKHHPVNLHLLCAADQVDAMDDFLSQLEFPYNERRYRAEHGSLVDLGRAYTRQPSLEESAALREGVNQFKVNFDALKGRFTADGWATTNCVVAVAGGSDGTSGVRDPKGGFEARRQEIERFAHVIFDSNPNQRQFWLGRGSLPLADIVERYGAPKLCMHGSDKHTADELGVPDGDRYMWIKGDPAFDTLRHACIEPAGRSHIGPNTPTDPTPSGRISTISVASGGWFPKDSLPINAGLVAIIGARGSGKTALADLIATGAGSQVPFENPHSFVRRAGDLLAGSTATAEWTHGARTEQDCTSPDGASDDGGATVRYLSQQFVEKLCAADGISDELIQEVERVVFNTWPVDERLGTTSFNDLLDARLESARARQETEISAIVELSEQVVDQRIRKDGLVGHRTERTDATNRLADLQSESEKLTASADQKLAARFTVIADALAKRQQEAQQVAIQLKAIERLITDIRSTRETEFPRLQAQRRATYAATHLDDAAWQEFEIRFAGDVDGVLASALTAATAAHVSVLGGAEAADPSATLDALSDDELAAQTVRALTADRDRIQKLIGIDTMRTKRLKWVAEQIGLVRTRLAQLGKQIADAEAADAIISDLNIRRERHYGAYFDALLEEQHELEDLYGPLSRIMAESGQSVAKLRFSVKRMVDVDSWAVTGERFLDLRKDGAFRGRGELARLASTRLLGAWRTGDGATAAAAIQAFAAEHSRDLRQQGNVDRTDRDAYRDWERDVARWLYDASHVTLSYSLEYDGVDIQRLSPGTRGIVLLLLYLAVDQEEAIPLIIDQPEENLDPESVYTELVELFRSASERRQVIMVTHNANLVVNSDVDQVIIANCGKLELAALPELTYLSGGLESASIRAAVCQILEGGENAFRERARRLRMTWGRAH